MFNYFEKETHYRTAVFALIVLFALLRSYHLTSPLLDRHSWNQVSTAATAMNIYKDPATFWAPDFNAIQDSSDSSVMAQEFPVFMGLIALGYSLFGPHIAVARIIAILIAFIGWIYLLKLCRLQESRSTTVVILFIYTLNAHNWFFDRAIQSDTGMVSFMIVSFYYFIRYIDERRFRYWTLLTLTTTLAGLFKPFGLMIGISFVFYLWRRKQLAKLKDPSLWLMGLVVWAVNLSWLLYTKFELSNSIGIGHHLGFNLSMVFSWDFPYTMAQRIFDQILNPFLGLFFLYALFSRRIRTDIGSSLLAGNLFYMIYITHGNLEHNYYQLPLTPALCIYSGIGLIQWLRTPSDRFSPKRKKQIAAVVMVIFVLYSGKRAWNHFRLSLGPMKIGHYIQSLDLDPDTKLLAVETSGTRYHEILYYADLKGYVARKLNKAMIEKYKEKGVDYVAVHLEEKEAGDPEYMAPFEKYLKKIWSGTQCEDNYSRPCFIALYKIP